MKPNFTQAFYCKDTLAHCTLKTMDTLQSQCPRKWNHSFT